MRITIPGPRTEPFIDAVKPRTLSLDDQTVEMAKVLGADGNASRGIRAAVRFAYDAYQANRFIPRGMTTGASAGPEAPPAALEQAPAPAQPDAPGEPPARPGAPP